MSFRYFHRIFNDKIYLSKITNIQVRNRMFMISDVDKPYIMTIYCNDSNKYYRMTQEEADYHSGIIRNFQEYQKIHNLQTRLTRR